MRRPLTLPILLLASALAAPAFAAPVILSVPEDGWVAVASRTYPSDPNNASTPPFSTVSSVNGRIRLENVAKDERIFAFNTQRNLGIVGTPETLKGKAIQASAATHVLNVNVALTESTTNGAVPYREEAGAELRDIDRTQTVRTVDGTLAFRWVRVGDARIQVTTRHANNESRTVGQRLNIEANGLSGYTVDLGGFSGSGVATTGGTTTTGTSPAPAPASSTSAPTTAPSTGGTIVGNLLSLVIGLGVVGGLTYAAWRYARANPEKVGDVLGKIGADVPKPLDPDPPATTPSTTPAPAAIPSGPIILDPAPAAISVPQPPISLGSAATGVPKLVGSDGSAFELPEGETVVGREALGGLMITHDTVSRRHARLVRTGGSVSVEDLGSTNGTWVNDASAPASLYGGESVRFGQVAYRYEA